MGSFSQGRRCLASAWRNRRVLARCGCLALCLAWPAIAAAAQAPKAAASSATTVRVTRDDVTIWRPDFKVAASVVKRGTVLTVVGRRGDWYEVIVAPSAGAGGTTRGFIYSSSVELVTGSLPELRQAPADAPSSASSPSRTVGVWGWGHFGYTWFSAHDSFQAVLGQPGGGLFGGGAEVRLGRGFFVGGGVERFSKTGERVFVSGQDVFRLGIPDTISITPIAMTAGWRFVTEHATPYVGGGAGSVLYKETSSFADEGENIERRFRSYHLLGGVEFRNGWVATAFEVQYSRVPDALGVGGASAAFAEHDLGGFGSRIKIMVGH